MKKIFIAPTILLLALCSCGDRSGQQPDKEKEEAARPVADRDSLIVDYKTWWSYQYYNIALVSDYEALSEDSESIAKGDFLQKLTTGGFIPIEVESSTSPKTYQLFALPDGLDNGISTTMKNVSMQAYELYQMEGRTFPDFDAVDLDGVAYNNEQLKGKTTIMKTWFIGCKACIAEMPELNEFVKKYEGEEQIQFVSLALDPGPSLMKFLERVEFDYAVIGEQDELIQEKLDLSVYPTHMVVDEEGIIKRVFDNAAELIAYVDRTES